MVSRLTEAKYVNSVFTTKISKDTKASDGRRPNFVLFVPSW